MYYVIHTGLLLNEFFVLSMKHRSFFYTIRTTHFYCIKHTAFLSSTTVQLRGSLRKREKKGVEYRWHNRRREKGSWVFTKDRASFKEEFYLER